MGKIITVNREFASGGREFGKRLSEKLNIKHYDKELIDIIAKENNLCCDYVEKVSETYYVNTYPMTIGRSLLYAYQQPLSEKVQLTQSNFIKSLKDGNDCVIVGRCADYLLADASPLKIFIYCSDMDKRIERCYNQVPSDRETKSIATMKKEINQMDKKRAKYYEIFTGRRWHEMENYNLCIDTAKFDIDKAVNIVASLCL